jgi:hypothetical protein
MLTNKEKMLAMSADYFDRFEWGEVDEDGILHL